MTSPVRAVTRAFAILQIVSAAPGSAGLAEIADAVGLPKSTASRILSTLEHLEMVEKAGRRGHYRMGAGVDVLAGKATSPQMLRQIARPYLETLVARFGEDAALTVPDGRGIRYLSQLVADRTVQVQDWTGHSLPFHTVASGQVCMAGWSRDQLDQYLQPDLVRLTARTVTDPQKLRGRLDEARSNGYAWAHEESAVDVSAVAAPVKGPHGLAVAMLAVHGPCYRFPGDRDPAQVGRVVKEVAGQLARDLAGFSAESDSEATTLP